MGWFNGIGKPNLLFSDAFRGIIQACQVCTRLQPVSDWSPRRGQAGSRLCGHCWGWYHDLALASCGEMNSLLHLPAELKGSVVPNWDVQETVRNMQQWISQNRKATKDRNWKTWKNYEHIPNKVTGTSLGTTQKPWVAPSCTTSLGMLWLKNGCPITGWLMLELLLQNGSNLPSVAFLGWPIQ